jgi:hypothetical protein
VSAHFRPLIASGLIEVLSTNGPMPGVCGWSHLLRYALLALLERPHSNLLDIMLLFLDIGFRNVVLTHATDPQARQFWENHCHTQPGHKQIFERLNVFG